MDLGLNSTTLPIYGLLANAPAAVLEEQYRRREEVFQVGEDLGTIVGHEIDAELYEKVLPLPSTCDLEKVFRLEIPFEISYRLFREMTMTEVNFLMDFLHAKIAQQEGQNEMLEEYMACKLNLPREVLERQRQEQEDSPEQD